MNTVYLLLGSNIGNSMEQLLIAKNNIELFVGKTTKISSLYSTAAWGLKEQPDFINQVIKIVTGLNAEAVLENVLAIEKKMGRIRTVKNAARIIDIDILFFNTEIIITKKLSVPHIEIPNRRFVLTPLAEIAGSLIHPSLHKSVKVLLKNCTDTLNVQKI